MAQDSSTRKKDPALWTSEDIVKYADSEAQKYVRDNLKTNQIRKVFAQIVRIRTHFNLKKLTAEDAMEELILLKPMLAYSVGRNGKSVKGIQEFIFNVLEDMKTSNDKTKALNNFLKTMEAIVAYHKFLGGKD